jgi:hypothetical protein
MEIKKMKIELKSQQEEAIIKIALRRYARGLGLNDVSTHEISELIEDIKKLYIYNLEHKKELIEK